MSESNRLYARARGLIPGGTQLLSKRPETFLPGGWPAYYRTAKGAEIEDLDGRILVDVGIHSVGACPLGYADEDVERAVVDAIRQGSIASLNCPEEVALAERLTALHPFAEMVRYTRSGGEAMAVAVRIARAATGRERIAFCGYHGWHDFYLAANLADPSALDSHLLPSLPVAGVPAALTGTAIPFAPSDPDALDRVADAHGEQLAALVIEPARYALPPPGYLAHVRQVADRLGAVLIFDEITTGFRCAVGGLCLTLDVDPDVAVFAKAMSNGYPMGAIVGRRPVMESAERTFISSTYWTDRIGPTAALATIQKMAAERAPERLAAAGRRMRAGWIALAEAHGLSLETKGIDPLPSFTFEEEDPKALLTLYTQWMLEEGYLAGGAFYASLAHTDRVIDGALAATGRVFERLRRALDEDRVRASLAGPVAHAGPRDRR